jgi:hypothetical protein
MQRSNFFNDQHVLADDLNNIESTKIDSIKKHTLALIASGSVIGHIGDIALLSSYTSYPFPTIDINAGSAITSNGEIIILSALTGIIKSATPTWSTAGPGTFYIKLQYAEASGSFKSNDLGVSSPTRYTDSYLVTIDAVPPISTDVCLASGVVDNVGDFLGALTDLRTFISTRAVDDHTYLSASPIMGHTVVKDHILAKGSGTQTTTNPHGITLNDLGYSEANLGMHWQDAHTNGIMLLAKDTNTLNSWSGSVVSPTSNAYLIFTPPSPYTVMNVRGSLFSGSLAPLLATSAPSDGVFWVAADGSNTARFLPTGSYSWDALNSHKQPLYIRLGLVAVSDSKDNIDSYVNMRDMYTTSQSDIRADFVESSASVPLTETSTLVDNLNRIRAQIGGLQITPSGSIVQYSGIKTAETVYHNTTSHPIFVNVNIVSPDMNGNSGHNWEGELFIGPTSTPNYRVSKFNWADINTNFGNSYVYSYGSLFGVVPPNFYYNVHLVGGASIDDWHETTTTP